MITIMVLMMKVPHGDQWAELVKLWPVFISYLLSFVYIGIYWVNHHHLVHLVRHVSARVMWANLHLLFWLSVIPFVTAWMGENHFSKNPTVLYAVVVLMAGIAYDLLVRAIRHANQEKNLPGYANANNHKGNFSLFLYAVAIATAFVHTGISFAIFVVVAVMWFIPDKRIEQALNLTNPH
ncbi:MAG: TMEM175 family protein [Burkholderiaceae bacterium]